jgi:hypothetical protein
MTNTTISSIPRDLKVLGLSLASKISASKIWARNKNSGDYERRRKSIGQWLL